MTLEEIDTADKISLEIKELIGQKKSMISNDET